MASRSLGAILVLALLALSACGGGDSANTTSTESTVSGDANPADVQVIDGWVTALRQGDVKAAAGYFAIPSVAENGPLLLHIENIDEARRFNESLPCGARLVRAQTQGQFTTATFRLTERPGSGVCGPGTVLNGASLTALTVMLTVSVSDSAPPIPVCP